MVRADIRSTLASRQTPYGNYPARPTLHHLGCHLATAEHRCHEVSIHDALEVGQRDIQAVIILGLSSPAHANALDTDVTPGTADEDIDAIPHEPYLVGEPPDHTLLAQVTPNCHRLSPMDRGDVLGHLLHRLACPESLWTFGASTVCCHACAHRAQLLCHSPADAT
jgi:hypothetical protein